MRVIVYIILILQSSVVLAQNPDYEMILFNKLDGLGQNYIYSTIQDKRGFLWVGTGNGVARYNGRQMENFVDLDSLQDNFVTSSAIDINGNLVFGHYSGGLTRYNGNYFQPIEMEDANKKIVDIGTSDSNKKTWAITQDGVIISMTGDTIEPIRKSILNDKVINCFVVRENDLLIGTNEGLIVIHVSTDGILDEGAIPEELEWINVTSLTISKAGTIWVGTEDSGIFKNDSMQSLNFSRPFGDKFREYAITTLLESSGQRLWIGTKRNGTFCLKLTSDLTFQTFNGGTGYPNFINTIYEDSEGSIWIGTVGEGLAQVVQNQFSHYNFKQMLGVSTIHTGVIISESEYLYATDKGVVQGIYNAGDGKFEYAFHSNKRLSSMLANFLYYDNDSLLWVSTNDGKAYVFNLKRGEHSRVSLPVGGAIKFRDVAEDNDANIWASVAGNGVFKLDASQNVLEHHNTATGFIHNDIFALYVDESNNVWFGAKAAGLAVLRTNNKLDKLTQSDVFPSRDINDIIGDAEGNIWISTDGEGLFEYNGKEFIKFDTDNGLYSMYCQALVTDIDNNLWVTHRDGLSQVNQKRLNKISTYNQNKGIYGVNTYYHTLFSDITGGVWFANGHELIRYNSNTQFLSENLYPFITDLRFFYEKTDLTQYTSENEFNGLLPENVVLPFNQNHITFDFIAVSLKRRNSIFYRHRLEGFEKKWSPPNTENSATYTNLSPGKYTLLVSASDNQYVWAEDIIKYEFNIMKPYWERWWFYALQIVFFIILIAITYQVSKRSADRERDKWILRVMVYVCLFIMFEYLQTFLEPYTENYTGGAPAFRILINLVLALMLFPVEGLIKTFFYSNKKNLQSK